MPLPKPYRNTPVSLFVFDCTSTHKLQSVLKISISLRHKGLFLTLEAPLKLSYVPFNLTTSRLHIKQQVGTETNRRKDSDHSVITSFLSQIFKVFFTAYTINEVIKQTVVRDGEKMKKLIRTCTPFFNFIYLLLTHMHYINIDT